MERFHHWLPEYAATFQNISENVCSTTLHDYFNPPPGLDKLNACYFHTDCIIQNLTETRKANIASASVLLGLMPTLLASLAPSIAEITLLSLDRPFFSLVVSLAVPSLYPTRTLEYDDPFEVLKRYSESGMLDSVNHRLGRALHLVSYAVAVGSIINIVFAVVLVSSSTILSWGCLNWYMPLIWVLLPAFIHLVSAVPFQLAFSDRSQRESLLANIIKLPNVVFKRISQENGDSSNPEALGNHQQPPWFVVFTSCAASVGAFIHLALGIYIFSSLLFVPVNDALSFISRLILTVFAARLVIILEIAHMSRLRRPSEP
ncbi:hypothetical protein F5Y09DRAFT_238197 [Xylaria sp. FL1042]|nr:hypothetical protein F5Y09DRAFT_238197 [Xylaria sp. FL1042]